MSDPKRIDTLLFDLVERLREVGWNVGLQQHLDAQRLLLHGRLPADVEQLRLHLAPLLCRSPREQADFDRHFHPWATEFLASPAEPAAEWRTTPARPALRRDLPAAADAARKPPWRNRMAAVLARIRTHRRQLLILLALLSLLGLQYRVPQLRALLLGLFLLMMAYLGVPYLRDLWNAFLTRRGSNRRQQPDTFTAAGVDDKTLYHSIELSQSAQRLRRHVEGCNPSSALLTAVIDR